MKRVLIIDDDCFKEEETIREGFAGTDIELVLCSTKDEGLKWINSKALFDCIILDWFLEDSESPILSMQILNKIEKSYFAPVLIYTSHAANYRIAKEAGQITYPDNLIKEVDKVDFREISTAVQSWLAENDTARLSTIYIGKIYESIHKVFCNLNTIPNGNIAAVYKKIICENGNIDWTHDFVLNLLMHEIMSDIVFRNAIVSLIAELQAVDSESTPENKRKVLNKILYCKSHSPYLTNGDIVQVAINRDILFGIIVTPNCDLAQKNTKYIELIELVQHGSRTLLNSDNSISVNNNINHFYLPGVQKSDNSFIDFVAVYKSKKLLISKDNDAQKYPSVNNRLKYIDNFVFDGSTCGISYLCSLMNPYKSEFLQKKHTHDSRIGIPEVYKYLNEV